jgi:hypothetical protein
MTNQTRSQQRLGGSPAGSMVSRFSALTLVAMLAAGTAIAGMAQEQAAPAEQNVQATNAAKAAQPATEKKPAVPSENKVIGGYTVHSTVELGGRFAEKSGSRPMWATMVNQTTGARVLGQSLQMRTIDPTKTPFFDTLSTSSSGYGGDPYDASVLKLSKGKWYDFTGQFRRDRNYFDYGLLANSLLTSSTPATPALVSQPGSLHVFNTVRRNTDTLLTILPTSFISFRAGYDLNTNEGPTLSTLHNAGDVQLAQWFRNGLTTYIGGVDVHVAKSTIVSYDQYYGFFKGDTFFHLAPTPLTLSNGSPVSLGVNTLATANCGVAKTPTLGVEVKNGVVNPYCSGTQSMDQSGAVRNSFPTEQVRFSSHYWDKVSMNGRLTYSGGTGKINHFNETFIGWNSRTAYREQSDTGAFANGNLAHLKRINVNADYGIVAELGKYVEISDAVTFWNLRMPSHSAWNEFLLKGVATTAATSTKPMVIGTSLLTPLNDSSLTASTTANTADTYLAQKNAGNTVLASFNVMPQMKLSAGWRFNDRQIKVDEDGTLAWHQNWLLLGGVVTPSPIVRVSANYEIMRSKSANAVTPSNAYTRITPNALVHLRARAVVKPYKWINFAVAGNDYEAKNDDPQVNHHEHNRNLSLTTQFIATSGMSFDISYAHDDVFSVTDLCYAFAPTANAPSTTGVVKGGTCANTAVSYAAPAALYLGNGYYRSPSNYFAGGVDLAPSKYFHINAGARITSVDGSGEMLNPYQVPGALQSKFLSPYADLLVNIAPQWSWHGNWNHQGYNEGGPVGAGLASRSFGGDIYTLGVKYSF